MALREKQKEFIRLYTTKGTPSYLNASESCRNSGYSKRNAGSLGSLLLKKPEVSKEIQARLDASRNELMAKADISKDELIALTKESLENVPDTHANKPRYIELIGKLRQYFTEGTTNNLLIFNEGENRHLNEKESTLKSRLSNLVRKSKSAVKRADTEIVDIPSTNERDA